MKRILSLFLGVLAAASLAAAGSARNSVEHSTPHSGTLHVKKECSHYTGKAGSFCTITSSNLQVIAVGSKIVYATPDPGSDSDLTLYSNGAKAFCHVILGSEHRDRDSQLLRRHRAAQEIQGEPRRQADRRPGEDHLLPLGRQVLLLTWSADGIPASIAMPGMCSVPRASDAGRLHRQLGKRAGVARRIGLGIALWSGSTCSPRGARDRQPAH